MNGTATFRTCAQTGLRVDSAAEWMIKVHAVTGVLAILFGGIAAVLVLLTRWPAVHLLGPAMYYRALTFHGMNMLIFWIIFSTAWGWWASWPGCTGPAATGPPGRPSVSAGPTPRP
jgi:heme/copper-type cytochrome/quinol oxidase subunit 1